MDVINLSLGEPEIEPSRDIVVAALDARRRRPASSRSSQPGTIRRGRPRRHRLARRPRRTRSPSPRRAMATDGPADVIAGFSDSGPTPFSLQLKPDVTAPGVDILSSLPRNAVVGPRLERDEHGVAARRGRGRAAQAAASGLDASRRSSRRSSRRATRSTAGGSTRRGVGAARGRRPDRPRARGQPARLRRADRALVRARQARRDDATASIAAHRRRRRRRRLDRRRSPAGDAERRRPLAPRHRRSRAGSPSRSRSRRRRRGGRRRHRLRRAHARHRRAADPVLGPRRDAAARRARRTRRSRSPASTAGNTAGKKSLVSSYRYPEGGLACNCKTGVPTDLSGPEQVFRITLTKPVANFGAAVLSQATGVQVTPRARRRRRREPPARLHRASGRPQPVPASTAASSRPSVRSSPKAGRYDFVFDTPAGREAGQVHVPLLGERRDAADGPAADARPSARASRPLAVTDAGLRRRPAVDRPRGRRLATHDSP